MAKVKALVWWFLAKFERTNITHATDLVLFTLRNTSGFLIFSGVIEREQWHESGQAQYSAQ